MWSLMKWVTEVRPLQMTQMFRGARDMLKYSIDPGWEKQHQKSETPRM